jgi:hypothetical protein
MHWPKYSDPFATQLKYKAVPQAISWQHWQAIGAI